MVQSFLNKIKGIEYKLDMYKSEVERLRAEIDGLRAIDYSSPSVQSSKKSDLSNKAVLLEEITEKYNNAYRERRGV